MKTLSDLKITVGIMTYNRPDYLKEAVHSVLQQSFKNWELIISNDYPKVAVTLDSLGIKGDPRIKIINQASNLGEVRNMNYLLEIAQGEWFVWLADDDLLHPEFLMLASKTILKNLSLNNQEPNIVGFFSNYSSANCHDSVFPPHLKSSKCLCYSPSMFLMDYSSRKNPLIGCYGVMHAATLRKVGGIPQLGSSFGPYGDTLIPVMLAEYGSLCWLDEPLVFLRTHSDSLSCKSAEFSAYTSAEVDFLGNLKRVCSSKSISIKPDKVIANMIRWFSYNEWAVLCRVPSLSKYTVSKIFIKYQISVNLPRLSMKYRINHIIFILRFLGTRFLVGVYKRLHAAFESVLSTCPESRPR
jgi:glycosyltransferase involved in cell wall biosynthesis